MASSSPTTTTRNAWLAVIAAGLGYFVDAFDISLFSIVRVASLKDLGLSPEEILNDGIFLLNLQMAGMLIGGLAWGVLGDKLGRARVMFASILLYSLANIANGFVHSVEEYAVVRFLAGFGLAGEIGAGITLVAELLPKHIRGLGTTIVAVLGFLGVIAASLVGTALPWRTVYIIGGVMGLFLLFLRLCVHESSMFETVKRGSNVELGNLALLFSKSRLNRMALCIVVGSPIWFVTGILVTLAPEMSIALGTTEPASIGATMLWYSIALALGDLASGITSQLVRSRKKVLALFIPLCAVSCALVLLFGGRSPTTYSLLCAVAGFFVGYWAVFLTMSAEQFGTNIRATAATSIPNFVRAMAIPITLAFTSLKPSLGAGGSAAAVGGFLFLASLVALYRLRETYGISLEFVESRSGVHALAEGSTPDLATAA